MKNIFAPVDRILTVEQVQKMVADFYRIKMVDLTGKRRVRSLALPRQIAMYLCRKHVHSSFPEIGERFGSRDHTTVMNACRKIERVLQTDLAIRGTIESLRRKLSI